MNLPATKHETSPPAAGGAIKFIFASGARPLAGYTIKRGVGRGGFGEVYYAISDGGKEVALKLIRRNLDVELRGVTHCLNLKHPHLLAIFDVKQDEQDNSWIVMEYVSGMSLDEVVERHPQGMPLEEVTDWMRGIAAGVAYLHDHGIVHRDLKPGNIFLDEGVVKLGDYGLSKFISCSRRSGQTESVGTVHYMAPEVANGRYGKEIDIYALGIICYEMLTGHVPFEGESIGEVLMKHLTAEPDLSRVPESFRDIVGRALAKDPDIRYGSVNELIADLPAGSSKSAHFVAHYTASSQSPRRGVTEVGIRPEFQPEHDPAAAPSAAPLEDDEPILRMLRNGWQQLSDQWANAGFNTPTKICLLLLGIFLLATNAAWMVSVLGLAIVAYGAYRLVRAIVLSYQQSDGSTTAPRQARAVPPVAPVAPVAPAPPEQSSPGGEPLASMRMSRRRRGLERTIPALPPKSPRERFTELTGSLLFSATVAAAISIVMVLLRGQPPQPEQFAWLALVSIAGAWAVLIPAKLWEGVRGEQALRRFIMLVVGLGLGAVAYGMHQALWVDLPFDLSPARPLRYIPRGFYDSRDGSPLLFAYLGYFGFLFAMVRWWRQADPLRPTRLSLWAAVCSVVAAFLLNLFWTFPQPWGLMVAATISIAVQLSSPWAPPRERFSRQAKEANL